MQTPRKPLTYGFAFFSGGIVANSASAENPSLIEYPPHLNASRIA